MSESAAHFIPVQLAQHTYEIVVQPGLLGEVGARLARLTKTQRAVMLTDSNVETRFGPIVRDSCAKAGITVDATCIIPAGEDNKTIDQVARAYDLFLRDRIERSTPVIALGGGVVGDMAGFVAATLLRGVPFLQIPTTLLSMVDASVGGKTGVNHPVGKNLIGSFHQPIAVFADPMVLKTLPPRELRGGLAECIKHDLIRDAEGFSSLDTTLDRILALDIKTLTDLVAHNVRIKSQVVMADPFEKGERAHLNFGHTFGHAIENVSHYLYSHGECVALGMVAAAHLCVQLELLGQDDHRRIVKIISKAGLPIGGIDFDTDAIVNAMAFDKKVKAGKIRFVLLDRIGHAIIRDDVPIELVRRAVESLRS